MENHYFEWEKNNISMAIFHSYVSLPEGNRWIAARSLFILARGRQDLHALHTPQTGLLDVTLAQLPGLPVGKKPLKI